MKPFPHLSYLNALTIVTIVIALIYVAVQQNYRMTANDPAGIEIKPNLLYPYSSHLTY